MSLTNNSCSVIYFSTSINIFILKSLTSVISLSEYLIHNSEINVIAEGINVIRVPSNVGFNNETYNIQNSVFNLNGGQIINGNFNNAITPPVIINNINNTINNGALINDLALTKPDITINES